MPRLPGLPMPPLRCDLHCNPRRDPSFDAFETLGLTSCLTLLTTTGADRQRYDHVTAIDSSVPSHTARKTVVVHRREIKCRT